MKVYLNLVIFAIYSLTSCNREEPKEYFPFKSFLTNELNEIDSLPIAIFKFKVRNGKADTSIIEKNQFREIAISLLDLDLQEKKTIEAYKELVLEDTDIQNITIRYSTENQYYPIKQLQLNISTGTTIIKNFYAERLDKLDNIRIVRKILWSSRKDVSITSIYYKNNKIQDRFTEKYSLSIQ
jgi:S-adenosylmethionine/arginine decarboxylase-like enzyme